MLDEGNPRTVTDDKFWSLIRQAILAALDAIERRWDFSPTTAEIRKKERERRRTE